MLVLAVFLLGLRARVIIDRHRHRAETKACGPISITILYTQKSFDLDTPASAIARTGRKNRKSRTHHYLHAAVVVDRLRLRLRWFSHDRAAAAALRQQQKLGQARQPIVRGAQRAQALQAGERFGQLAQPIAVDVQLLEAIARSPSVSVGR